MGKEKQLTGILPIRERGLIAVKSILKEMNASDADILRYEIKEGRLILTPQITVDKDQAWFWSKRWQDGEREAEDDKLNKRTKQFDDVDNLMEDLLEDMEQEEKGPGQ